MIREVNEVVGMHSNARQAVLETNNPDGSGGGNGVAWGLPGPGVTWVVLWEDLCSHTHARRHLTIP